MSTTSADFIVPSLADWTPDLALIDPGPTLLAAYTGEWRELDLHAGRLLEEWAISLAPVVTLREVAQDYLVGRQERVGDAEHATLEWSIAGAAAAPSSEALDQLREASRDEGIVASFRRSESRLRDAELDNLNYELARLTMWDASRTSEVLGDMALPVLVGLAVISGVERPVGSEGRRTLLRLASDDVHDLPETLMQRFR